MRSFLCLLLLAAAVVPQFALSQTASTNADNPLLSLQAPLPFERLKPEHVEPGIAQLLAEAEQRRKALAASTGPRTFDNTMVPLEDMTKQLSTAMSVVRTWENVASTPPVRAAVNAVLPKVSAFYSGIPLDAGIWRVLQEYAATDEAKKLPPARKRFLQLTLDEFRRAGAQLNPEQKARLEAIDVELSKLTTQFAQNAVDSTKEFELVIPDEKRLAGLPDSALAAARQSAQSKNMPGWRFTLQMPSYLAVITYLNDATLRERMWRAFNSIASEGKNDNKPLIQRIVALRQEKAKMLGFGTFADLTTNDRMAKNGATVKRFLSTLDEKTRDFYDKENTDLFAYRRSIEGPTALPLQPWDLYYYAEKLRSSQYNFSDEELRPYFSLDRVLEGLFTLTNRLYGISVKPLPGVVAWDPSVKYYEVRDGDNTLLGTFYADFFPRETKRSGAWMSGLLTGDPLPNGRMQPHLGLVAGNLTSPVAGKPALLTHREVETVFHELGHLLHHMFGRVPVRSLSGTDVAWDFVELPSQIMENFTWERETLDLFARHYETNQPIPEALFSKMRRARTYRAANAQMRQLSFGTTDILLHTDYNPEKDGDAAAFSRTVMQRYSPAPLPSNYSSITAFSHLFASPVGYAAGYYSYKWAEQLDADAFTRFQKDGLLNAKTGREFRERVLQKGNSEPPEELFRSFMGRDPDPNAMLRRAGLVKGDVQTPGDKAEPADRKPTTPGSSK